LSRTFVDLGVINEDEDDLSPSLSLPSLLPPSLAVAGVRADVLESLLLSVSRCFESLEWVFSFDALEWVFSFDAKELSGFRKTEASDPPNVAVASFSGGFTRGPGMGAKGILAR
jgi:hypothetical protein